jgi:hypothetical protein
MATTQIRVRLGMLPAVLVELVSPIPFVVRVGDRCVIRELENGPDCPCVVDRVETGSDGAPLYYLSRH